MHIYDRHCAPSASLSVCIQFVQFKPNGSQFGRVIYAQKQLVCVCCPQSSAYRIRQFRIAPLHSLTLTNVVHLCFFFVPSFPFQRPPSSSLSYGGAMNDDVRSPGSGSTPGPLSQQPPPGLDPSDPGKRTICIPNRTKPKIPANTRTRKKQNPAHLKFDSAKTNNREREWGGVGGGR